MQQGAVEGRGSIPEREEVLDLLLAGVGTDVLDENGVGRHDGGSCFIYLCLCCCVCVEEEKWEDGTCVELNRWKAGSR